MDKPSFSVFEQLLKHAGIVVDKEPLKIKKPSSSNFPLWENLIEELVAQE